MEFYFAISQTMLDRQAMPELMESGTYSWSLTSGRFLAAILEISAGKVLDAIAHHNASYPSQIDKIKTPYAICKATASLEDLLKIIREKLICDGNIYTLNVTVSEITWIK